MRKLIKEPLVHFMLLGAVLFGLYGFLQGETDQEYHIVVDNDDVQHIVSIFELQWQRPPTAIELERLMEKHIEQEIFYREALQMNLDHNDQVVKRRLAQKMEFLSADLAALVEPPGEESLQAFFQENKENYLSSPEYSFYQVPFFSSNHENPAEYAEFILLENKQTTPDQMRPLGDNTSLPFRFSQADRMEIIKSLGEVFIADLDQLPLNQWTGPVASGLGWHLVFITEKTRSRVPVLEEVRSRVLRDFEREKERETREAVLTSLRDKYQISITAEDLDELTRNKLATTGK